MRRVAIGLLAMILATLIGWRIVGSGDDDGADTASPDPALDAYARDVTLTTTDGEGRIAWRVRSPDARHNRHDNAWRLVSPEWRMETDNGAPWRGSSNHAWIGPERTRARLTGDVVMERQRRSGWTRLTTSLLELDIPARYAETDRAVTLTQPDTRIDAVGARAWLDERRIELLNNVEGHHDAASS
ncbi:LPS export ABC transporter periplasmic protein LptC [Spiribacter vilamensis]|uniref:Lipopolysaccharide export system protein LptC n=1 Tax=Spiribacter vilamensis TaxID=531306 RepID=A0A4Q8CY67_9GAMM|nr:LPS export ABC transporter periplasmic protein LptC [Spiribacter vilamensis]RZU97884.1 lipopolysaccharide export system protein LptC [Spiribacter vilamensis]TVO61199.1 LPS export ABC transporter periplasmic protein LptC [Spiribacter vilamensis]